MTNHIKCTIFIALLAGKCFSSPLAETQLSQYKKLVSDAVESRWRKMVEANSGVSSLGTVKIHFFIDRLGRVHAPSVVSNDTDKASLASVAIGAVMDSDLPPIPDDLVSILSGSPIDMELSFSLRQDSSPLDHELPDARLGDSVEHIQSRYGVPASQITPLAPAEKAMVYGPASGIVLTLQFWQGRSCAETYAKANKSAFSNAEISRFLETNANGSSWGEQRTAKNRLWKRADGKALAFFSDNELAIFTSEYFAKAPF